MSVNAGERHIKDTPSNNMFYAVDSAKELAIYTIKICSNTNIFKQDYSMITQEIINNAMTVYRYTWTANHIRADSENNWIIREKYEKMAIVNCNTLLCYIDLAKRLYHLRCKKSKYWAELTIKTRNLIQKWHESDRERYRKLVG